MKKSVLLCSFLGVSMFFLSLSAQTLKPRPDAFPWVPESNDSKALNMANSVSQMANWNCYPTYQTYLDMMQQWATDYHALCHVDTIGTSIKGRLILSMYIAVQTDDDLYRPEFFYSSTMHGDEVTGFVMMLRLIDTLLKGYGNNPQYTDLINSTRISINPLSNPDGTYNGGNNTLRGCMRYNSNWVDLNRNYPDPFGTAPMNSQQKENTAMINYLSNHNFKLSANLHGGSEVMNYPWDSFTSSENPHPDRDWWIEVCKRFIDTSRLYNSNHFIDVNNQGYIEGGDWYIISNGRQDYVNYYHGCREMTMEISTDKTLSSDQLPEYWRFLQHSLVNYIAEIHNIDNTTEGIDHPRPAPFSQLIVFPNPANNIVSLREASHDPVSIFNMKGQCVLQAPKETQTINIESLPKGIYSIRSGSNTAKLIKR